MFRLTLGCLLWVGLCGGLRADDAASVAQATKTAQSMTDAIAKGEYARIIDHTHEGLIKFLGGREKAIEITRSSFESIKATGGVVSACRISEPGKPVADGKVAYIVVPMSMEMTISGKKIVVDSYFLGVSPDGGEQWKFIDGSGLEDGAARNAILPALPAGLRLPKPKAPRLVTE